jgi:outer membrane protein assembly factor BamB
MKAKNLLLFVVFSLLTQSCIITDLLFDNPLPERTLETNDEYEVIWSLPRIPVDSCKQASRMTSTPGIIFLERVHSLLAIDSLSGTTLWQIEPASGYSGIILAEGTIVYHASSGVADVEAYNIANGTLLWKTTLPDGHSADTLYFAENKIFVSTNNSEYYVVNDQGEVVRHVFPVDTIYVEMDGILYLQDIAIRAIDMASVRELWRVETDPYDPFRSPPIFDAGTIFARTASFEGFIYSIDQHTGKVNWKMSQNIYSNLFVADGKIYFISLDGYLVSIDRNSGAELSKVKFTSTPFEPRNQDYCITGDLTNNVLAIAFGDNNQILGIKIKNP